MKDAALPDDAKPDDAVLDDDGIRLTEAQQKHRRQRNLAIAGLLIGLVVLFYIITIVKMGPAILSRPL